MRKLVIFCVLAFLATPGFAQSVTAIEDLYGIYRTGGMTCQADKAGTPGGPVLIDENGLGMAGINCSFGGTSSLSRMSAVLVDASCSIGGVPRATRLFLNLSPDGVTIVSRELGTFVLDKCT